jgi:hypothetical protein
MAIDAYFLDFFAILYKKQVTLYKYTDNSLKSVLLGMVEIRKLFWKLLQKRINHKDFQLSTTLNKKKKSNFRVLDVM